jgi:Uma2 family endonuclease
MPTLVLDPQPAEIKALIERRRRVGQDLLDEVWEGVLHMNPAPHGRHLAVQQQLAELFGPLARGAGLLPRIGIFNLGGPDDYRVPDGALFRLGEPELYYATAALVVEIVSPGDESYKKLEFYAEHNVEEVLMIDPETKAVEWFALSGGAYTPVDRSGLIELGAAELADQIDWP